MIQSQVSCDAAAPRPGDRVRVVFEAEWLETDDVTGHRLYDPVGGYKHSAPPSAKVEVLERARDAAASNWSPRDEAKWQELTAEPVDDLIGVLAEAARRHGVMVNISVSPYESDADDD